MWGFWLHAQLLSDWTAASENYEREHISLNIEI